MNNSNENISKVSDIVLYFSQELLTIIFFLSLPPYHRYPTALGEKGEMEYNTEGELVVERCYQSLCYFAQRSHLTFVFLLCSNIVEALDL